MKPLLRDWLINIGLVLLGVILLAAGFSMRLAGQRTADEAVKAVSPVAGK
jgi:hypothetical protein